MTIAQHVSELRSLVKQYSQSLSPYTDSQLYGLFTQAAAFLTTKTYEKGSRQSWFNSRGFCVKLIEDVSHPCPECASTGCKVLVSTIKIPKVYALKNRELLRVSKLDDTEIHLIQPYERKSKMEDEFFKNVLLGTILNDKLVVYARNKPTTVIVRGHWVDILDWQDIPECGIDGNETGDMCLNPLKESFHIDPDLVYPAYNMVLDQLGLSLKLPQDNSNNANNQQ